MSCICGFLWVVSLSLESGFWSVVTPVPLGTHEFKFLVDGQWRVSSVHPTATDPDGVGKVNIRSVQGML